MTAELHVNVDHVATIREARKTFESSPLAAVKILESTKTSGITTHLREDRRHIQDSDIYEIDEYLRESRMGLTFEMAATEEIRTICLKTAAKLATVVPEKREEVTTEGGMDVLSQLDYLKEFIKPIQAHGTKVSLFIDPINEQIDAVKKVGADFIELHTGTFANSFADDFKGKIGYGISFGPNSQALDYAELSDKTIAEIKRLKAAAKYAQEEGLTVNLGHGLTVDNLVLLLAVHPHSYEGGIPGIKELHIGHSLIANSIYMGVKDSAELYLELIESKKLCH